MKLKVGYRDYKVVPLDAVKSAEDEVAGYCDRKKGTIEVLPTQETRELVDTLLHETLHAIWHERDLPADDEERIVRALAHGLTALAADNPGFFPAIQHALAGGNLPFLSPTSKEPRLGPSRGSR